MKRNQLLSLIEQWKLLRSDFDSLNRDYPGVEMMRVDTPRDLSDLRLSPSATFGGPLASLTDKDEIVHVGSFHTGWVFILRRIGPAKPKWLFQRASRIFEATVASGALTGSEDLHSFEKMFDDDIGVDPNPNRWINYLVWFALGKTWISPEEIFENVIAFACDACSHIAEQLLMQLAEEPEFDPPQHSPYITATWRELAPSELAEIFDISVDTVTRRLKEQFYPNERITTRRYLIAPSALPQDWEEKLSEAKGTPPKSKRAPQSPTS